MICWLQSHRSLSVWLRCLNLIEMSEILKFVGLVLGFWYSRKEKILQGENILRTVLSTVENKIFGRNWKSLQVYLCEKETEAISAIRNTVNYDAENLGLCIWNSNIQHEVGVCHNQEKQCEQATLHSDSTLYFKGKWRLEASCICQLYFEWIQRTVPKVGTLSVCW